MKRFIPLAALCISLCAAAENMPAGYYQSAIGLADNQLKTALANIINPHTAISYGSGTWEVFYYSDRDSAGYCMDMYCDDWSLFTAPGVAASGCNIEHSFAKSWWGGSQNAAYKDCYHLNPSNSVANSSRSNYPLGVPTQDLKTGTGSLRVGKATYDGQTFWVFEPKDEYKGDFARAYFYMATCYGNQLTWRKDNRDVGSYYAMRDSSDPQEYLEFLDWEIDVLLQWSRQDPVSQKEINRQNAVSDFQHNRNPYIDYPHLEEYIWGVRKGQPLCLDSLSATVFPDSTITIVPQDTTGTTPQDTSVIVPPSLPFEALPATNVSRHGFMANWTFVEGGTYTLDVYQYEESDFAEIINLPNMSSESLGMYSDNIQLAGNTYQESATELRLGTGKGNGTLTISNLQLTARGTLTINAKSYGSDESSLVVSFGDNRLEQELTAEYADYTFEIPAGTTEISLSQTALKKRVIISSIQLTGGGRSKVSLSGYPVRTDTTSLYVNVSEEGTYFYQVSVSDGSRSEEIMVVAEGEEETALPKITYEELHIEGLTLTVTGIVSGANVRLYGPDGRLLFMQDSASIKEGTCVMQAPHAGIYLLQVGNLRTKFMVF